METKQEPSSLETAELESPWRPERKELFESTEQQDHLESGEPRELPKHTDEIETPEPPEKNQLQMQRPQSPEKNFHSRSPSPMKVKSAAAVSLNPLSEKKEASEFEVKNVLQTQAVDPLELHSFEVGAFEESSPKKKTPMWTGVIIFANTVLGSGIIGLPYALKLAGAIPGLFFIAFLAILVDWTVTLLAKSAKFYNARTYEDLAFRAGGVYLKVFVSIAQFLFSFGGMWVYLVAIADSVPPLLGYAPEGASGTAARNASIWIFAILMGLMSVPKGLNWLSYLTSMAMFSIWLLVGTLLVCSVKSISGSHDLFSASQPFHAIGIISFIFVCHHGTFRVYRALGAPTVYDFSRITHISMIVSSAAAMLTAASGYAAFGTHTEGNILKNLRRKYEIGVTVPSSSDSTSIASAGAAAMETMVSNPFLAIARLCVILSVVTTFPLECSVAREVIEYYSPSVSSHAALKWGAAILLASLVACATMFTNNMEMIMVLTGSVPAAMLAYVIPPFIWLRTNPREPKLIAYLTIVFGFAVAFISLIWH